jgi:2-polyprenyl-6-methoxyphenol hydroxylase-like FAD-dependent oxidoreductase
MSTTLLGERAIVLGAGIAGTLAARALADHFEHVLVLERDGAPDSDGFRRGLPQAKLLHGILRAGLDCMNRFFPGFEQELVDGGAVPCRSARDVLFVDALGPWPQQDTGVEVPLASRAFLDRVLRRRLLGIRNVELRGELSAQGLIAEGDRVLGVTCRAADGTLTRELADFVVDATGRAAHTAEWLESLGFDAPEETRVEVDLGYACCFVRPRTSPPLLGAVVTEPPPHGRFGAAVNAQEGERMIVGIATRGRDISLPEDYASLLASAERLPHPAPFELMRDAEPLSRVARFGFAASVQRHYERLTRLPSGFLCIGDAICSFNPVWGQGMSVAALEVAALADMLAERSGDAATLESLPAAFYAEAARIITTPWQLSVGPDFAYETTRGDRPPGLAAGRGYSRALARLAMQDPDVRGLLTDVYHLVKPREVLFAPELLARVQPLMAPG